MNFFKDLLWSGILVFIATNFLSHAQLPGLAPGSTVSHKPTQDLYLFSACVSAQDSTLLRHLQQCEGYTPRFLLSASASCLQQQMNLPKCPDRSVRRFFYGRQYACLEKHTAIVSLFLTIDALPYLQGTLCHSSPH